MLRPQLRGAPRVEEGTPRPEEVGGAPGEEPAGPLGNPAGSGDPERRKGSPGPLRAEDSLWLGAAWEGPGLGLAGVKLDPFNAGTAAGSSVPHYSRRLG